MDVVLSDTQLERLAHWIWDQVRKDIPLAAPWEKLDTISRVTIYSTYRATARAVAPLLDMSAVKEIVGEE
jgi:hypothetical protein